MESKELILRGDSFDIGSYVASNPNIPQTQTEPEILRILQNPAQLTQMLSLTEEQASNISAIITGAGAGLSSKYLSKALGPEIAGALGGLLGGYVSGKIVGKRK